MKKALVISCLVLSAFLSSDAFAQNNGWQLIWHDEDYVRVFQTSNH